MTGFNLPPGCSVSDIPGNRPEDMAEEAWWEAFDKACEQQSVEIPQEAYDSDWFAQALVLARDLGYTQGANEQRLDDELARAEEMWRT